jgi:hypothetical protein
MAFALAGIRPAIPTQVNSASLPQPTRIGCCAAMFLGERHIRLNGVFMPAKVAAQACRKSVVALHVRTGVPDWPIANRGTGFLYQYKTRQFCVFAKHQILPEFDPEQVAIRLSEDGRHLYSCARFTEYRGSTDEREEFDVCTLQVPWTLNRSTSGLQFFLANAEARHIEPPSAKYFTIGYLHRLAELYGEEFSEGMHMRQVCVWADGVERKNGDLPMLQLGESLVMRPQCEGDFSGFSGAPVFAVDARSSTISFQGIVLRGGHDKLFFAPVDWVDRLCDHALRKPAVELKPVAPIEIEQIGPNRLRLRSAGPVPSTL